MAQMIVNDDKPIADVGAEAHKPLHMDSGDALRTVPSQFMKYSRSSGIARYAHEPINASGMPILPEPQPMSRGPHVSFLPFLIYGIVAIAVAVAWLFFMVAGGSTAGVSTALDAVVAMAILGIIAVLGFVLAIVLVVMYPRQDGDRTIDIVTSSMYKYAVTLIAITVVWFLIFYLLS